MSTSETVGLGLRVHEAVELLRAERDRKLAEHARAVPTRGGIEWMMWQRDADKLQHAYDWFLELASAFHPDAPAFEPAPAAERVELSPEERLREKVRLIGGGR